MAGPPTNLTPGSYEADNQACISLDGSKIVYRNQKGQFDLSYTYDNVFTMNPDGSGKTELQIFAYYGGNENFAGISADGSKVLLQQTSRAATDNGLILAVLNPFSKTILNLAGTSSAKTAYYGDTNPVFSSDGSLMAFLSYRANGSTYQAYYMKPIPEDDNGGNVPVQITNFPDGAASGLCPTPDGKLLLVKTFSSSHSEIFRVDLSDSNAPFGGEGNNLTQITNLGTVVSSPCQLTAGGRIFFIMAAKNGATHVFSINPDGTGLHQVTGGPTVETTASVGGSTLVATLKNPVDGAGNLGPANEDVYTFALSSATDPGTVTGTLTASLDQPVAGATVNAYDGATLAGTTTTDANGQYSLSLAPGGYTLEFVSAANAAVSTGVAIYPGGASTSNASTSPSAAPAPVKIVATVKWPNVNVRWAAASAPANGYTITGYNVYRATSLVGPWTKVNASPIAAANPLQYTDTAPGNLATAFYRMTTVTSNGSSTAESAYSNISQAANNLAFNGSFEQVDGNGAAIGWTPQANSAGGVITTSTAYSTDGTRCLSMTEGSGTGSLRVTSDVLSSSNKDFVFSPPIEPGVPVVEGMFAKYKSMQTTWPLVFISGALVSGYSGYWYNGGGIGGNWDATPGLTNPAGGDTEWIWQANTGPIFPFEFGTASKLVVYWNGDSTVTQNVSTCLADDLTYQRKSFTDTGSVFGRIVDTTGKGIAGVTVKVGGVSLITSGAGNIIVKNVPTGDQTMTVSVPHQADVTTTIHNYGGCRFADFVVANPGPFTIDGHVYYPDGSVCAGADVRLVLTDSSDNETTNYTTTTDATGYYTFGSDLESVSSAYTSHIVAHKNGFVSARLDKAFGASGWSINNNLTLYKAYQTIQAAHANTAPTIDGTITPGEWSASQVISFPLSNLYAMPQYKTKAYMLWDTDNLYMAFVCEEPNPAGMKTSGVCIWGSDPFWIGHDLTELRFDPTNGGASGLGHEWWQFLLDTVSCTAGITSNDSGFDQHWFVSANRANGKGLWDASAFTPDLRTAIGTSTNQWVQEVKIPWTNLCYAASGMAVTTPNVGDEWACQFGRGRTQPSTAEEYTSTDTKANGLFGSLLHFVNTVTPAAKGDVNGDGVVDNLDAVASLRIAAGLQWVAGSISQADVNNDTKADLSDTLKIVRKINGKDSF